MHLILVWKGYGWLAYKNNLLIAEGSSQEDGADGGYHRRRHERVRRQEEEEAARDRHLWDTRRIQDVLCRYGRLGMRRDFGWESRLDSARRLV